MRIGSIVASSIGGQLGVTTTKGASTIVGPSFKTVLSKQATSPGLNPPSSGDLFQTIQDLQVKLFNSKDPSLPELLRLQSYANSFNTRVELVSKAAESANTTLKRLQNGQ